MRSVSWTTVSLTAAATAVASLCAPPAWSQDASVAPRQIYQQRTADGRIVLTDRPVEGVRIQRTWPVFHEDPVAAAERRDKMQLEAAAVSERIQRQLDRQQQRADQAELERLRIGVADARRETEIARDAAREGTLIYAPRLFPRFTPTRPARPPVRGAPSRPWPKRLPSDAG